MSKYDIRPDFECQKTKNEKRKTNNEQRITNNEKRITKNEPTSPCSGSQGPEALT